MKSAKRWLSILSAMTIPLAIYGCSTLGLPQASGAKASAATGDVVSQADKLATEGGKLLQAGRYDDALVKINQALQLRIDKSYYHLLAGIAYHMRARTGDRAAFDLAEQGYDQAIHFDRSNWLAYYYRARLNIDINDYGRALDDLSNAMLFRPNDPEIMESFAFTAYRAGRPDLAGPVLDRLTLAKSHMPEYAFRNAAITNAALDQPDAAARDLRNYCDVPAPPQDCDLIRQRIADWAVFYRHDADKGDPSGGIVATPVQATPPSAGGFTGGGAFPTPQVVTQAPPATPAVAPTPAVTTAPGTENTMVVIDVVMIETAETIDTSKGVNLLNGLQLQFGNSAATTPLPAFSITSNNTTGAAASTNIVAALSIPAITYSINIANANNNRNEVLSRPTLVGQAGKQSQFFSGDEVLAAAVASVVGGIAGQSINIDKDFGVRLQVTPAVLADGRLELAVTAERTFLEAANPNVNFPLQITTAKDTITANVVMRYGESLILGGLSEKESVLARNGVPGLQDVPLLQYFFSNEVKQDTQKSVLILMTPRLPQYVFQPDAARQAFVNGLPQEDRPIAELQARYSDWFKPYPNWASIFHHLQDNGLYREFRTGDVNLESWSDLSTLRDRLDQALEFLHY